MAVPAYIDGQTQDSGGALSLTFDMSTITHTTDDLLIAFVKQSENTTQRIWDDDGGGGNGWAQVAYNRTTRGRDQETALYYKFATSASESDPTFTWASGITTEQMSGSIIVYRGVDTVTPFQGPTYLSATNDANPPNPSVQINFINTRVVCFHAATHDDISTVAAPTGFTLRTQVWNGTANAHRNHFTADIEIDTLGTYSPPDWQHSVLNTTPEYHTYTLALNEAQPIHVTSPAGGTRYAWAAANVVIGGDGFGASQLTGKVEFWSDTSGTVKTVQTIDSWSDTSIQIDFVQGSLVDGSVYIVVTNDSGDVSGPQRIVVGLVYEPWNVSGMGPDHFWTMDNTYDDVAARDGVVRPCNSAQGGTPTFEVLALCRAGAYSLLLNGTTDRTEVADSQWTNITNTHSQRNIGGWIRMSNLVETPGIIYEEGGGVNNIYMLMLPNGRLCANVADSNGSPDFKAQAYSDFALEVDRNYHVMIAMDLDLSTFRLWVDGEEQSLTANEGSLSDTTMSAHSGDWCFGDPDGYLDTGGVDIAYNTAVTVNLAYWGTWSKSSSSSGNAPLSQAEIRDELFRTGALREHAIAAGTEAAQQTAIEAFDGQTHANYPLTFEIGLVTGDGDVELTITDQVWPGEVKFQVLYLGAGQLTIRNSGTSNFTTSRAWGLNGGTFVVIETAAVQLTVRDILTSAAVQGARVLLLADSGGPLPSEESATITRSGSTATVSHTAHGLTTGTQVVIRGADQEEYNRIHTVTVLGDNAYTYTVTGTPTTPATGTITSTAVIMNGDTDVGGQLAVEIDYSADQPFVGVVRKGSASTYYKPQPVAGTIPSTGYDGSAFMISDE